MKTLPLWFVLFLPFALFCQETPGGGGFNSPENIKNFADFLFCSRDFLRAAGEYERLLKITENDTIRCKLALSFFNTAKYSAASDCFKTLPAGSPLNGFALNKYAESLYLNGEIELLQRESAQNKNYPGAFHKLALFSMLNPSESLILTSGDFISGFSEGEKEEALKLYNKKENPGYASPVKAALLSAILPGAGKAYAGQTGDGVISLLVNGLFGYLAYDNFNSGHKFRGWLFSGLGLFFYSSNIYGAAAQAVIYNAEKDVEYKKELDSYLKKVNYFSTGEPEFCK
jgi:TM2 domain-containing membrane protein YozV